MFTLIDFDSHRANPQCTTATTTYLEILWGNWRHKRLSPRWKPVWYRTEETTMLNDAGESTHSFEASTRETLAKDQRSYRYARSFQDQRAGGEIKTGTLYVPGAPPMLQKQNRCQSSSSSGTSRGLRLIANVCTTLVMMIRLRVMPDRTNVFLSQWNIFWGQVFHRCP